MFRCSDASHREAWQQLMLLIPECRMNGNGEVEPDISPPLTFDQGKKGVVQVAKDPSCQGRK
jgi:hypothetical protein